MTDGEFEALVRLVERRDAAVDDAMLGRIADALSEAAEEVVRERTGRATPVARGRRLRVVFGG